MTPISYFFFFFFFFNDTATTEIYTLSLHDALPISGRDGRSRRSRTRRRPHCPRTCARDRKSTTSELQSRENLVCRLLLEKKKKDRRARRNGIGDRRAGRCPVHRRGGKSVQSRSRGIARTDRYFFF